MKIALVSGIVVDNDAISNSVVWQANTLPGLPEVTEVDVFSQYFNHQNLGGGHVVSSIWELVRHPRFAAADIAIFHFGIRYQLFPALHVLSRRPDLPRTIVHYHNVTPPHLTLGGDKDTQVESLLQAELITYADRIWAVSDFNRSDLVQNGVEATRISVVPIPVAERSSAQRLPSDRRRVLAVGRLVPAKGLECLIDAFERLPAELRDDCELVLVGNPGFSDPAYIAHLRHRIDNSTALRAHVRFAGQPTDDELWKLYLSADVLATATHHEGLCLPILEAGIAGCAVAATRVGNIPNLLTDEVLADVGDPNSLCQSLVLALSGDPRCRPSPEVIDSHRPASILQVIRQEFETLLTQQKRLVVNSAREDPP